MVTEQSCPGETFMRGANIVEIIDGNTISCINDATGYTRKY